MPTTVSHSRLEELVTGQSPLGAIWAMAVPTIISQLVAVVYNYADSIYVGWTNEPAQVAAIALALPLSMTMTALGNFWGVGGGSAFSRSLGRHDMAKARRVSAFSFWLALVTTGVLSLLSGVFSTGFARLLGASDEVLPYAKDYFFWLFVIGGVPTVLSMVMAHFARAEGYARQAGIGLTLGGVLNIVIDPLFIFPFGLNMGVTGAALATMLSNLAAVCYFAVFFYRNRRQSSLSFAVHEARLPWGVACEIMSIGLPSALLMFFSAVSNGVLNNLVAEHGKRAVAAVGIAKKLDSLPAHIGIGLTQGALPLLSFAYASQQHDKMKAYLFTTLKLAFFSLLAVVAIMEIAAWPMCRMFIEDAQTLDYATSFIRILCLSVPLFTISGTINTCFQAMNCPRIAFVLSLLRKGLLDIPLMIFLHAHFFFTNTIWAQPIMDVITVCISLATVFWYFRRRLSVGRL